MSNPVPLSELTFIPQSVRNRLRRHGFGSSSDLLRVVTVRLAKRLGSAVKIADIVRWQRVCSTLEIEGVTLPWARVLGEKGGVVARDVSRRKASNIAGLFAQALQRGDVEQVPDADAIAAMMVDSARIDMGGVLNATVVDKSNRPVKGAVVRCAAVETTTDEHGRARLLRLPRGQPVDVVVEKNGYAPLTKRLASLENPNVVEAHRFSLKRGHAPTKHSSKRVLSEFDGDVIPIAQGQRVRSIEVKNRRLREQDILHFFERLQDGEVKLSSRYKELVQGNVTIPVWRLPGTSLPQDAAVGSDYIVTNGGLEPITVTSVQLARWRIARQVIKEVKPSGSAAAKLRKTLKEYFKRTRAIGSLR